MGFIITLIMISNVIIGLTWLVSEDEERALSTKAASIICTVIATGLCMIIVFISYFKYVGAKQGYANITNIYHNIVKEYTDNANVPTGVLGGQLVSDVTDKKYEDYQDNLKDYIDKVRYEVTSYNNTVIGKQVMNKSWYWRLLIYYPEELTLLKLNAE